MPWKDKARYSTDTIDESRYNKPPNRRTTVDTNEPEARLTKMDAEDNTVN